jgi:hypothetical protein
VIELAVADAVATITLARADARNAIDRLTSLRQITDTARWLAATQPTRPGASSE